jgi:uncharacterized protein (TIGR03083 family)
VGTYRASQERFTQSINAMASDDADLQIQSCPDWNVHGLLSHVTGLCKAISQNETPPADTQNWVDQQVVSRQSVSTSAVAAEWNEAFTPFSEVISANMRLAMPLTYDLLVHEFDLNHALGKDPVLEDTDAQLLAMNVAAFILDGDITQANIGSLLLVANDKEWQCGSGDVVATLDLSSFKHPLFEFIRLTGSRRSHKQLLAYPWQGNYEMVLPFLSHMELPLHDIVE